MIRTKTLQLPGRRLDLTLPLAPQAVPAPPPCAPNPQGVAWFSDLTGAFTEASEAAYLLPEGAVGPVLGVAQVLGETCGDVHWSHQWTPESGAGGAPELVEDGAHLIVYARAETVPGILEVSARSASQSFGPILLTLLRYRGSNYGYYSAATPSWRDASEVFDAVPSNDTPMRVELAANASRILPLVLRPGVTLPDPAEFRVLFVPDAANSTTHALSVTLTGSLSSQTTVFSAGSYPLVRLIPNGAPQQLTLQSSVGATGFLLFEVRSG